MANDPYYNLKGQPEHVVREAIRSGHYQGPTSGLLPGKLQCNLVILQGQDAIEFEQFCRLNPKACPLAGMSQPGNPHIARIGSTIDITRDAARYNIYRDGVLESQQPSVDNLWQDDMVAFAIGCSFTFEYALERAGIVMHHIENGTTVPMYQSSIATQPSGKFQADCVVSMRPIPKERFEEVNRICAEYPIAHGAPIHYGTPKAIGINDLDKPDWGDSTNVKYDEEPVFWLCGVTPQVAIMNAAPKLAITHAPGAMLIADVPETLSPLFTYNETEYFNNNTQGD